MGRFDLTNTMTQGTLNNKYLMSPFNESADPVTGGTGHGVYMILYSIGGVYPPAWPTGS